MLRRILMTGLVSVALMAFTTACHHGHHWDDCWDGCGHHHGSVVKKSTTTTTTTTESNECEHCHGRGCGHCGHH